MSDEQIQAWRAQYRATTEAMESILAHELAALTDSEALRQIE